MINIVLYGCGGNMGRTIRELVKERDDCQIVAGVDINVCENTGFPVYHEIASVSETADVVIDFSHPSSLSPILGYCEEKNIAAVLCTTGYDEKQVAQIKKAAGTLPLFYSRNMSLGINLLIELAKKAELILGTDFDVEIIEKHHNQKIDAPSGTALMIADAVNETRQNSMKYTYDRHSRRIKRDKSEIGLHAVRGGTIVGEHEIIFAGRHETLSISHSAQSKELFASGAVNAAVFMYGKPAGLYDMTHLV